MEFELGKRYLVRKHNILSEVEVLEISPSKNYIKFEGKGWNNPKEYVIVEELSTITGITVKPGTTSYNLRVNGQFCTCYKISEYCICGKSTLRQF